jgi:uncharacterized protein YdeI (YjbR/CyaY-like superfamily)
MNPKVNWFFDKSTKWQEAYQELRELALFLIDRRFKWDCPCYTIGKSNIFLYTVLRNIALCYLCKVLY